jgi:hypothetical protein
MNERSARDVVLVQAIESADASREVWTDDDRAWALRTAGEIVGEDAPADAFLARRAALVLERLRGRFPRIAAFAPLPSARGWTSLVVAVGAFVVGALGADVGATRTINLLAPPVLALVAWKLAVYAVLLVHAWQPRRPARKPGGLRRAVARWLRGATRMARARLAPTSLVLAAQRFTGEWTRLAMPLWQQRAARLLHVGAACLALGMIAGLYLRGIALEFRANWQSTFLGAADVSRILRVVLAPGEWLTGIRVPDAAHLQAIANGGENAAAWIHLYAATIFLVVIAPRVVLAAIAWLHERRLATRFPLPLDTPYVDRLLRAWREGTAPIVVVPYSFDVPNVSREGLARLLARVHPAGVDVNWLAPVAYGDDTLPDTKGGSAGIVALFNLSATPEPEAQGAFVAALRTAAAAGVPIVTLVDTSQFAARFTDARRVSERERAWRNVLEAAHAEPIFVRLAQPDEIQAESELSRQLDRIA